MPVWFEYVVLVAVSGTLCFGGIGLFLAVIGRFSPALAFVLGTAATVVAVAAARPRDRLAPLSRSSTAAAMTMCVVSAGIAVWNSVYVGHHVALDRDPGLYAVAGRWLANHHSLVVPAGAAWAHTGLPLSFGSPGMYPHAGATLEFQFAHMLPVLLGLAYRLGGNGLMFRIPAVIGAFALCAVYLLGCRILRRPWVVLAAVSALGVSLPALAVMRETFSEPVILLLLWGGIVLLLRAYEERRVGVAIMAGLAVGGTLMAHIDAAAYLAPLPLLGAVAFLAAGSVARRRSLLRVFAGVLVGLVPTALLGTYDVARRAGGYYRDLHSDVMPLYALLIGSAVAAAALVVLWPMVGGVRRWVLANRRRVAAVAAGITVIGLVLAWSLRPAGPKAAGRTPNPVVAIVQKSEGLPYQPTRTYAEQSMRWIEWYIGPLALALAIAGLAFVVYRVISRGLASSTLLLAMTGPLTVLYIWRPSITPDQIWATRRFVPVTLPLLALAAGIAVEAAAALVASRLGRPGWTRWTLWAGAMSLLPFSLAATLPVAQFRPQADYLPLIQRTCTTIGSNGAVLFPANDSDSALVEQTVRSFCNVPSGALQGPITAAQLQTAAAELRTSGRQLWILGSTPNEIASVAPGLSPALVGTAVSSHELERTLSRPPSNYTSETLILYGARVS